MQMQESPAHRRQGLRSQRHQIALPRQDQTLVPIASAGGRHIHRLGEGASRLPQFSRRHHASSLAPRHRRQLHRLILHGDGQ
jgi:hypothetical protein